MSKVYTSQITVSSSDIDELQHVNNVRYLQWVQDIAKAHWETLATPTMVEDFVWVVANHYIEYKGEAKEGDELLLKTYVNGSRGITSIRMVEIYKGEILITKAKTTWCLLSAATRRPVRIPETVAQLFA